MTEQGKFATVINCMDGRVQLPAIEWLKKHFGVDYVDSITEPGPNKILADNLDKVYLESIKRRLAISVNKHGSRLVAVFGHYDCAGNPVDKETQIHQIQSAINTLNSWGFGLQVVGFWIDEKWQVNPVS